MGKQDGQSPKQEQKFYFYGNKGVVEAQTQYLQDTLHVETVHTLYFYRYAPTFMNGMESHNFYELFYVVSGVMLVEYEDKTIQIKERQFILIPPMIKHGMRPDNCYASSISLSFYATGIDDELIVNKAAILSNQELELLNIAVSNYVNNLEKTEWSYRNESPMKNEFAHLQMIRNALEMLLISITRDFMGEPVRQKDVATITDLQKQVAGEVAAYITAHCAERLTLEELSKHFGYSVGHLCRIFKMAQNDSIINFMLKERVKNAVVMMENTDYSLQRISDECGFDTIQYFSKIFKRYIGMTPREYKNQCKNTRLGNIYEIASKFVLE
ncbi:MAG: AraC family transcriptional regulator [Clostridia bacterium]|nr:AraC family transcriptional regulator [Clostridia bacterium]